MTAEIAVLNREAAALAADSAVTLRLPEGNKIYQTNKLFALSKYEPIGIMVYGNAGFMGLPWETIIKSYRAHLGQACFPRLSDYGSHFLAYLERSSDLFPLGAQEEFCYHFTRARLQRLKMRLHKALQGVVRADGTVTKKQCRSAFIDLVSKDANSLKGHPRLLRLKGTSTASVARRYGDCISRAIKDELEGLAGLIPRRALLDSCIQALLKDLYWSSESGVVIAGFGTEQVLPCLRSYITDGIVGTRLRVKEDTEAQFDVTNESSACIRAFAQSEMVGLFMNGIDRDFAGYLDDFINRSFVVEYPALLQRLLQKHIPGAHLGKTSKKLVALGEQIVSEYARAFQEYSRSNHWWPVIEIVNYLPKEELAAMAEALVNLTSFKRHVTKQAETVGGPIDVAIISRGDGLIWIKRKHYFSKDLNQHFLSNYYNDVRRYGATHAKKVVPFP